MLKKILLGSIMLILIGCMVFYWQFERAVAQLERPLTHADTLVTIKQGDSFYAIVEQLQKQNLMENNWALKLLVKINPQLNQFKAGVYLIQDGMDSFSVIDKINQGQQHTFKITFLEGSRLSDWLVKIQQHPDIQKTNLSDWLIELAKPYASLEGLLFPDTYHFPSGTTDRAVIQRAFDKMQQQKERLYDPADCQLSWYEILTLASIIEKETAIVNEMPLVASVFYNRLNKKMRLQTDPSIIYGLGDTYQGDIKRTHLDDKNNPYNTYHIKGLTPTPIAMPGAKAISAAIHPAKSNYLYFVADGRGGHVFSEHLAAHNKAVAAYLKTLKQ